MTESLRDVMSNGNAKPRKSIEREAPARKRGRPGPQKKVEDDVIVGYLRQGYSQSDIARAVGLSPQAISKRIKRLGHRAVAAMFHADSQLWGVELKTMSQLAELNSRLLGIAQGKDRRSEEVIAAAREIRQQLDFQMRFQDALKVQQRFEEFRETVLAVLDELGQELGLDIREKVMVAFKRRTEARLMLTKPRLAEGRGANHSTLREESSLVDAVVGPGKGGNGTTEPIEAEFEVKTGETDDEEEGAEGPDLPDEIDEEPYEEEDEEGEDDDGVAFDL
jgi:DNA-binding Lrp family transcriptional regulator